MNREIERLSLGCPERCLDKDKNVVAWICHGEFFTRRGIFFFRRGVWEFRRGVWGDGADSDFGFQISDRFRG